VHDGGHIFSRDLEAGGTFLGFSRLSLNFGAITNVRSRAKRPISSRSRGELITSLLAGESMARMSQSASYTAFNLWHGTVQPPAARYSRSWPDNEPAGGAPEGAWQYGESSVPHGEVIAHSNEPVGDSSSWPKTRFLQRQTAALLRKLPAGASVELLRDSLAAILSTQLELSSAERPDLAFSPLPDWREKVLQDGPFISRRRHADAARANGESSTPPYGTLCQTILISCARTRSIYYFHRDLRCKGGDSFGEQTPAEWQVWCTPWDSKEALAQAPSRWRSPSADWLCLPLVAFLCAAGILWWRLAALAESSCAGPGAGGGHGGEN